MKRILIVIGSTLVILFVLACGTVNTAPITATPTLSVTEMPVATETPFLYTGPGTPQVGSDPWGGVVCDKVSSEDGAFWQEGRNTQEDWEAWLVEMGYDPSELFYELSWNSPNPPTIVFRPVKLQNFSYDPTPAVVTNIVDFINSHPGVFTVVTTTVETKPSWEIKFCKKP